MVKNHSGTLLVAGLIYPSVWKSDVGMVYSNNIGGVDLPV